ncbi:hypothetical protein VP01_1524g6 [Puccinia sorghi]|uniref:Uncharacterized protein n=1 Tax=Puccinia sorghi TaxID=27349 RepID=A0A0L6VIW8_9BASI|nr:hypothetical protein VP01_1524g6 [Puccinia sorghi]
MDKGKHIQGQQQIRHPDAPFTLFTKAPKGLPLDFYDSKWYNNKLPAKRQDQADIDTFAFLKNTKDSLCFKDPLEKWGDKCFTEERWAEATKEYDLEFAVPEVVESGSDNNDESDYGRSIDLNDTDGEESKDKDEDEYSEGSGEDIQGDFEMRVGCRKDVDEDYEEFDDCKGEMMAAYGKGTYTGWLADNKWNTWQ